MFSLVLYWGVQTFVANHLIQYLEKDVKGCSESYCFHLLQAHFTAALHSFIIGTVSETFSDTLYWRDDIKFYTKLTAVWQQPHKTTPEPRLTGLCISPEKSTKVCVCSKDKNKWNVSLKINYMWIANTFMEINKYISCFREALTSAELCVTVLWLVFSVEVFCPALVM